MRSWGLAIRGCADHGGVGWTNTDIWRIHDRSPAEAGLDYEAYLLHRQNANYISDNRGAWQAPRTRLPGRQTHLLVHPIHWPVERAPVKAAA
jgi:hypothetical protein